jgi:hypothetical protein
MQDPLAALPHILSAYDAFLTPFYFLLLLFWVIRWKKKHYDHSPLKKFIIPAFVIKAFSCILLSLLYEFYYGYSDAHNYFTGATEIWNATKHNPIYGLELVFKPIEKWSPAAMEFGQYMSKPSFVAGITNMFKISGFIGMFCFGTYLPIALVISLLSFIGSWKICLVFAEEFPAYAKKIAFTCLFAPSFIFWSTNIMKDPLCIFGLGLCVSALYNLMKGRFKFSNLLEMIAGAVIMLSLKSYIFYLFCIAACFAIYIHLVTSLAIKFKVFIRIGLLLVVFLGAGIAILEKNYFVEAFSGDFMNEVKIIQITQIDAGGSLYILPGVDDLSFIGIVKTYINSLNVALFRPYPWEIPNLIAIANAMESFAVLLLSFYLLIKLKIFGFFKFAFQNRILAFALLFTLLLAPLAGLVSFSFGTLVRYKAPMVPFYYTYLAVAYLKTKEKKIS